MDTVCVCVCVCVYAGGGKGALGDKACSHVFLVWSYRIKHTVSFTRLVLPGGFAV